MGKKTGGQKDYDDGWIDKTRKDLGFQLAFCVLDTLFFSFEQE